MKPNDFLSVILPEPLETGRINILQLPSCSSAFFVDAESAANYAESKSGSQNIYFSLSAFGPTAKKRGKEADVAALLTAGIDIDLKSDVHSKDNLPATTEEALKYVDLAFPGMRPTIITHTGNGIQCFYVLKEPVVLQDDADRASAKQFCADVWHNFQYHMAKDGYTIDSTFDLARVMRVAGTYNIKDPKNHKLVKVLEHSGQYYEPEDLEPFFIEEKRKIIKQISNSDASDKYDLVLDSEANPPEDKMVGMKEDPDFVALWNKEIDEMLKARTKSDGTEGDCSLSMYDMKLASKAVRWSWTPQEIANLIIGFRRRHAKKPEDIYKALRSKYMCRTISMAFESYTKILESENLTNLNMEMAIVKNKLSSGEKLNESDKGSVTKSIDSLSSFLGARFKKLLKYTSDPASYEILFEDGRRLSIGPASNLLNQQTLRTKVFEFCGVFPPAKSKGDFEKLINWMGLKINQDIVETAGETRDTDRLVEWVNDYVQSYAINPSPDDSMDGAQEPFMNGKRVCVFGARLRNYIMADKSDRISPKDFGLTMRKIGCKHEYMNFTRPTSGNRTSASVYDVTDVLKSNVKIPK